MSKKGVVLIIVLLFSISAYAAQTFDAADEIVSPPAPPDEKTSGKVNLVFELKDYNTKNLISDIHVNVDILDKSSNNIVRTLKYVGQDGKLQLGVAKGTYDIILKVDKLNTNGRDYYVKFDQEAISDISRSIYLMPVGSLIGNVYDKDSMIIKNAEIKIECSGTYGEIANIVSDDFGSFSSYWLPVGQCRLSAAYGSEMGFEDVELKAGELKSLEIKLSRGILSSWNVEKTIGFIAIVIAVLFMIVLYVRKKPFEVKGKSDLQPVKKEINNRSKDIIKTLRDNEKSIVDFLLKNDNKSTQAKIKYGLGIPKTSVIRVLQSLEMKNIVKIERIGKLKKVELTDWFIGKS